jgi:protein arginine N-methyltransferase 7
VFVLETNRIRKKCLESFISENGLENKVTIVEKLLHELDVLDYENNKFNILFSELSFSQALLPWENLYFYYGSKQANKIACKNKVKSLPCRITLKAIAVDFEDLDKIRSPVGVCEGFDLTPFDKIILEASKNSDGFQEPHPLWEYPCKPISLEHEIFSFEFNRTDNLNKPIKNEVNMPLIFAGKCNGIAIWQSIQYDEENELNCGLLSDPLEQQNLVWSINYKQAVHLFEKKYLIHSENKNKTNVKCSVKFDIELGKFNLDFKINE